MSRLKYTMLWILTLVSWSQADVTLDLSEAEQDQKSGQYCSMQKVCITNPPDSLTSSGCSAFPPGCDCDPLSYNPDGACPANYTCNQCRCLPVGCDCDPASDNPDELLCPINYECNQCKCLLRDVTAILLQLIQMNYVQTIMNATNVSVYPKDVTAIPSSANPRLNYVPNNYECKPM
eukprot:TRINITY_DN8506_c0_g1_i1.p1 TRINITY_DN8506_c0_g1~~TRINITY_DN8506_c0_g1_i1.p1  ORF type:complete len:177 (-),score=34.87 TRINITY_DN8506_c0_g1_i1:168-698(-)